MPVEIHSSYPQGCNSRSLDQNQYSQLNSLLQQPGPKNFKLSKIELIYKAKKFKVRPFTIQVKSIRCFLSNENPVRGCILIYLWEFPKMGDPNIVP